MLEKVDFGESVLFTADATARVISCFIEIENVLTFLVPTIGN